MGWSTEEQPTAGVLDGSWPSTATVIEGSQSSRVLSAITWRLAAVARSMAAWPLPDGYTKPSWAGEERTTARTTPSTMRAST